MCYYIRVENKGGKQDVKTILRYVLEHTGAEGRDDNISLLRT